MLRYLAAPLIAAILAFAPPVPPTISSKPSPAPTAPHSEQGGLIVAGDTYVGPANFVTSWVDRGSPWSCDGLELRSFDQNAAECVIGSTGYTSLLHTFGHGFPNIRHGSLTVALVVRAAPSTDEPVSIDYAAFEDGFGGVWLCEEISSWPIGGDWCVVFLSTGDDFAPTVRIDSPEAGITLGFAGAQQSTVTIDYVQIFTREE